jgi:hypothetical protein
VKNIQVIDGATNVAYDIFQVSDEVFVLIFPEPGQNIEFEVDWFARNDAMFPDGSTIYDDMWDRPQVKSQVQGIHGTLFYELKEEKAKYYPNKRESDMTQTSRGWHYPEE